MKDSTQTTGITNIFDDVNLLLTQTKNLRHGQRTFFCYCKTEFKLSILRFRIQYYFSLSNLVFNNGSQNLILVINFKADL